MCCKHCHLTALGVQMLVLLVWLGVFSSLILFCWELAWKLQEVRSHSPGTVTNCHTARH